MAPTRILISFSNFFYSRTVRVVVGLFAVIFAALGYMNENSVFEKLSSFLFGLFVGLIIHAVSAKMAK